MFAHFSLLSPGTQAGMLLFRAPWQLSWNQRAVSGSAGGPGGSLSPCFVFHCPVPRGLSEGHVSTGHSHKLESAQIPESPLMMATHRSFAHMRRDCSCLQSFWGLVLACYHRVAHSILRNVESHWDTESKAKPLERMRPPGKRVGTKKRKWPRIKTQGPALYNSQAQKDVLMKEKEEDLGM